MSNQNKNLLDKFSEILGGEVTSLIVLGVTKNEPNVTNTTMVGSQEDVAEMFVSCMEHHPKLASVVSANLMANNVVVRNNVISILANYYAKQGDSDD